jgi:hypothetical protein
MDLWTEFEGVTIDSAYSLNKLLQTEGRSAFFSTRNARGESVLIRIIECHFDEDEILARWRGVQSLGHPNFLRIDSFGQFLIEEDGITAVYAVFERVDANLGQVLEKGRLSVTDAAQIGLTVASALETLHMHGFVHEHIQPGTIYAVGESVRLRSDCIRETPEGEAGHSARRRDVHDLALVLLQVLMGTSRPSSNSERPALPAPFEDIVRNGTSGEWGLAEIQNALASLTRPGTALPKAPKSPASAPINIPGAPRPAPSPAAGYSTEQPLSSRAAVRPEPLAETWSERRASAGSRTQTRIPFPGPETSRADGKPFALSTLLSDLPHDRRRWMAVGALIVLVVLIGWIFMRSIFGHHAADTVEATGPAAHATTASSPDAPVHPSRKTPQPDAASPGVTPGRTEWRVVAFTYGHKDQAQKKASSLAPKLPGLKPEIFSPNGHAPWLVTIGGALQKEDAYALARKARSLGLPADTYAQNYTAR